MQERTKKHPIESVELRFLGPILNKAKAVESLKSLGFVDASDSVPWREAYSEYSEEELIGKSLAGARYREGLTQMQLSEMTGISQRHLSEMEHGKRPIGKKNAHLLGRVLNVDYRVFL